MTEPIILYDIPGITSNYKAWSPNTWKARYCLNFKGIPYKTVWVEYPDIAPLCQKVNIPKSDPLAKAPFTLPAIYDPNTKRAVSESAAIARYLDETYPNTPRVVPAEADALLSAFQDVFTSVSGPHVLPLFLPPTALQLPPRSREYFERTRAEWFGKPLAELAPKGSEKHAEAWVGLEKAFTTFAQWLEAGGKKDQLLFMGDKISFADIIIASRLIWFRALLGEDSKEWQAIAGWNGGRWVRFMELFKPYETIDVGVDNEP